MSKSPRQIADLQLIAYNLHQLDSFCALFAQDAQLIDLPSGQIVAEGMAQIQTMYQQRFDIPELRCRVHSKTDIGDFAIDRETVYGLPDGPMEIVAMYEVRDSVIQTVYFIRETHVI